MAKKVTFFINDFSPGKEGESNELNLLLKHLAMDSNLDITLHDISRTFKFSLSPSHISYGYLFMPLGIFFTKYLEKTSDLLHVFGSLTARIYLKLLKGRPILLTNSSPIQVARVEACKKYWRKLDKVIVECQRDEKRVIEYGIHPHKVSLIYPAVHIEAFSYQTPPAVFTVGFASAPIANENIALTKRGVDLLLLAARQLPDVHFVLLWRQKHCETLKQLINKSMINNVSVINRILPDMNTFYGSVHCTILPSPIMDDCKPCPNSIMESLSAGKPVLISDNVGISDIVSQAGCALIFKPQVDDMIAKITEMRHMYWNYQQKARMTAEQYFALPRFVKEYKAIYEELTFR